MLKFLYVLVIAGFAMPASAQTIEVGKANWASFPRLAEVSHPLSYDRMVTQVEALLETRQCQMNGQSARKFDITVPYAVFVEADGRASRVLVADVGCAPLETMVGNVVADLAAVGDIKPAAGGTARWYASDINFTLQ